MTTVVFGVGHPDRGDDAAGLAGRRPARRDPPARSRPAVAADPSSILTDPLWDAADHVVVVDTVRTGRAPGTVHTWDLAELLDTAVPTGGGGTHDLGITATVGLAEALGRLPLDAVVIGIEGRVARHSTIAASGSGGPTSPSTSIPSLRSRRIA
jgi:hydrogenase maturation protease